MKLYHDYVVLRTHTIDDPLVDTFKVDKGLITWAGFFFPSGCHALVYAKLYFQAHQILPRNQEQWCHGDNGWWAGSMEWPVTAAPLECKVEAWANRANFNHVITLGLELTPWHMVPKWDKMVDFYEKFGEVIGFKIGPEYPTEYEA